LTRRSMQARRSLDPQRRSMGSNGYARGGDREGLMRAFDEEDNVGFGLEDLASDDEDNPPKEAVNGKMNGNGNKRVFSESIDQERTRKSSSR
jgi:hypothetical protein